MLFQKTTCLLVVYGMLIALSPDKAFSQENDSIPWLSFEELDDLLLHQPKPVFVYFYADWCSYCHQMDRTSFRDADVVHLLKNNFYAVKMNAEASDTIQFGRQTFVNERRNKRNPIHQIALLMASRKGNPFTLPAIILLDENFEAQERYFQYIGPKQLSNILKAN